MAATWESYASATTRTCRSSAHVMRAGTMIAWTAVCSGLSRCSSSTVGPVTLSTPRQWLLGSLLLWVFVVPLYLVADERRC